MFLQHSRLFASGISHDGRFQGTRICLLEGGKLAAWYVKTDAMQIAEFPSLSFDTTQRVLRIQRVPQKGIPWMAFASEESHGFVGWAFRMDVR